jgi:hypothetical protein
MTTSSRAHVYYGIGLVPIDFYILNRNDSKKLIEYCLREGCIIKDFICTCDKCIDIEKINQEMSFYISNKNVFIHLDKRAQIVNVLDKGLMAVIEVLKIEEE